VVQCVACVLQCDVVFCVCIAGLFVLVQSVERGSSCSHFDFWQCVAVCRSALCVGRKCEARMKSSLLVCCNVLQCVTVRCVLLNRRIEQESNEERWGAGVEYHFQEFNEPYAPS